MNICILTKKIDWYDKVRHFGFFSSYNIIDSTDVIHKRSDFIGYFNKLISNFAYIQPEILCNFLTIYVCSYYSSILWHYNSMDFIVYTKWNKSVRKYFLCRIQLIDTRSIYGTVSYPISVVCEGY